MVTISVKPHVIRKVEAPGTPKLAASVDAAHCGLKMYDAICF